MNEEDEERIETEGVPASICAIHIADKSIGVCCYQELSNTMYVQHMNCSVEVFADIIFAIKVACAPTLFLLHPQLFNNEKMMTIIEAPSLTGDNYPFRVIKSSGWSAEGAKQILASNVSLYSDRERSRSVEKRILYLSSLIDFDSKVQLQAVCALLQYIAETFFPLDQGFISIAAIEEV
jgi:hypothetical protein